MSQQVGREIGEKINGNSSVATADFIRKNTRVIANGLTMDEKIISLHKEKSTGEYYCVQLGAVTQTVELFKVSLVQAKLVYDRSPNKYTENITREKGLENYQSILIGVNDHMEQSHKIEDSSKSLSR